MNWQSADGSTARVFGTSQFPKRSPTFTMLILRFE